MGTTTKMAIPYPEATGLVKDGWEDMKDIATQVDAKSGLVLLNSTSFSAVSSQSLPANTFSSTFQNYKIIYVFTASTSQNHTLRLRASGTDATGANYNTKGSLSGSPGAVSNINNAGTTNWFDFAGSSAIIIEVDLYKPNEASTTLGSGFHYADGTGNSRRVHLDHGLSTAYDSLSLIASTGNMTGVVRAYGYNQ